MKKFFLILSICLSLSASALSIGGVEIPEKRNETPEAASVISQEKSGIMSTAALLSSLESRRLELLSHLKVEQERIIPEIAMREKLRHTIDTIDAQLVALDVLIVQTQPDYDISPDILLASADNPQVAIAAQEFSLKEAMLALAQELDVGPFTDTTSFIEIRQQYPAIRQRAMMTLDEYRDTIDTSKKEQESFVATRTAELRSIERDIDRLKQVQKDQASLLIKQIAGYIAIFVVLFFLRWLSAGVFSRFGKRFSRSHQQAILFFHRWVFNIIFVGAFLYLFAAELFSFLPLVAIIGTAVGLALRDVIYSFIGWFAVGSDSGYQEGDFIEFDSTQGRVYRITPLLTSLEEYGQQGFTGKIVSFPNKTIFEKNIKNWSSGSDFSLISQEFILTHTSYVETAKKLLMQVAHGVDYREFSRDIEVFKNTFRYTDEDLDPTVHTVVDGRGIIMRLRVLIHVRDRLVEQNRIAESFIALVQKTDNVQFQEV